VRTAYICGTAALMLLIPAGLAYIPSMSAQPVTSQVIAQLSGVLTGVLALQKMVGASLAAQQRYGVWWKVSSDLKRLWYGLQTKWVDAKLNVSWDVNRTQFVNDLDAGMQQARQLVSDEEADFFQKLTLPSVDVLDLLSKARPDVSTMIGALLPGAASANAITSALTSQATDVVKAKQDLAKSTSLLTSLDAAIAQKRSEIAAASDPKSLAQVNTAIDELLKRRSAAMIAKMEAEAAIAAATAH
jgi:hypothetical protein